MLPINKLKELKALVTKVEVESAKIMKEKKTALQAGDDKVAHQVGEGKDIMSILCKSPIPFVFCILIYSQCGRT